MPSCWRLQWSLAFCVALYVWHSSIYIYTTYNHVLCKYVLSVIYYRMLFFSFFFFFFFNLKKKIAAWFQWISARALVWKQYKYAHNGQPILLFLCGHFRQYGVHPSQVCHTDHRYVYIDTLQTKTLGYTCIFVVTSAQGVFSHLKSFAHTVSGWHVIVDIFLRSFVHFFYVTVKYLILNLNKKVLSF